MIKLLAVNVDGNGPAVTKLVEAGRDQVRLVILKLLNDNGKNSHVLIRWNDVLYTCSHTAKRGPSSSYHKVVLQYHPLEELLV